MIQVTKSDSSEIQSQSPLEQVPNSRLFQRLFQWKGFSFFCLLSLIGSVRLLLQPFSGHYRIFTGAGQALWQHLNPHGTDFGSGIGYWFPVNPFILDSELT